MRLGAPRPSGPTTRAIWSVRAVARAPRLVALLAAGVVALVGLKALVEPVPRHAAMTRDAAPRDAVAAGFAEAFARAYFTFDADAPDARERSVARFMPRSAAPLIDSGPRRSEKVLWTGVAAESWRGARRGVITVAVETETSRRYLAVTVERDERGLLYVPSPPALVGPPPVATAAAAPAERDVEDPALRAVATRVVTNYLAREREDLTADLAPGAVVSLADARMRVASVDGVTWADGRRGRIAVAVIATGRDGLRLALRYELGITRRAGRWLVQLVHTNPAAREAAS